MIIPEEAFIGNRVFSQVLKERKTQQQRTAVEARAVPGREQENSKNSTRTQQENAASKKIDHQPVSYTHLRAHET